MRKGPELVLGALCVDGCGEGGYCVVDSTAVEAASELAAGDSADVADSALLLCALEFELSEVLEDSLEVEVLLLELLVLAENFQVLFVLYVGSDASGNCVVES